MNARSLVPLLLLLLLLAACGGSPPVTMSDIPRFPGATLVEPGQSEAGDNLAQSLAGQALQSSVLVYRLPEGGSWEEVKAFYADELAKEGWNASMNLSPAAPSANAGWTRGSLDQEQALLLDLSSDDTTGEPFLLVALFSE
jgi:hypothetical protein